MGFLNWLDKMDKKIGKKIEKKLRKYDSWEYQYKQQLKKERYLKKQAKMKQSFSSSEEAMEYWLRQIPHFSIRFRNWYVVRRMENNTIIKHGKRWSRAVVLEKLAQMDETHLKAERLAILDSVEYLFTFTYDDAKYTERTFKKGICKCLRRLARKQKWKYIGVWQRGRNNKRLYLQAIVKTGNGEIIGGLEKVRDFHMRGKWMKTTLQSTYFNERFGRTSVEILDKEKMEEYRHHVGRFIEILNKKKAKIFASRKIKYRVLKGMTKEDIQ